jgi:hypothetical protein
MADESPHGLYRVRQAVVELQCRRSWEPRTRCPRIRKRATRMGECRGRWNGEDLPCRGTFERFPRGSRRRYELGWGILLEDWGLV